MRIQEIYPKDFPDNKFLLFHYKSNFYYDVKITTKENGLGWSFEWILKPFEKEFIKNLKKEFFQDYKENTKYFIMLNEQEEEIAQLAVGHQKFNNRARIWDIYIEEVFQRQGLGKNLIEFAENIAREWKCRAMVLECQSSNVQAINFYVKNGYSLTGFDLTAYSNNDVPNHEIRLEMSKFIL